MAVLPYSELLPFEEELMTSNILLRNHVKVFGEGTQPIIMQNADRPELTQELEQSFCSTDPIIARRFAAVTFFSDNRKDLPNASVPSLILQSTVDAIAPVQVGHYMHRQMPASTLQLMQVTGHCPHMSHPQETIQQIKEYLSAARGRLN